MVRPCINGSGKKRQTYNRISIDYSHKLTLIEYLEAGHDLDEAIAFFYGAVESKKKRSKKKQINKWLKQVDHIRAVCESGRGTHRNLREVGQGTVLSPNAERELAMWVNSFRKDGAPVTRLMLRLQAKELADECGLGEKFGASDTWIQLFLRRNKLSLRSRTRQGQTTQQQDAQDAAEEFRALVLQTIVENNCVQVYNADQTAVFFEYIPKQTITTRGTKTVWVKCSNKEKTRATAMLLADWEGRKYPPFLLFKSTPAKKAEKREANSKERNGFGVSVWREIRALQEENDSHIYGNKCAWWNAQLSLKFLELNFAGRAYPEENVLLLWDDFSGHWTPEVVQYASSLNVILLKVPPKYTYVCRPADVSWNKPFKAGLRRLWIDRLREQLAQYRLSETEREIKQKKLQENIARARKELTQAVADVEVARLRSEHTEAPFQLKGPNRVDIARWVGTCWKALTVKTITSGFEKVGILTDTRKTELGTESDHIENELVQELESCHLAGNEVCSDDDIDHEDSASKEAI